MAADPLKDLKRPPYSTLSSPGGHSERQIRQLAHLFEAAVRHEEEGDHAVGVRHGLSRAVLRQPRHSRSLTTQEGPGLVSRPAPGGWPGSLILAMPNRSSAAERTSSPALPDGIRMTVFAEMFVFESSTSLSVEW